MDIPGAKQHLEAEKAGYLSKLSGRSFPYIPQWKRRYCVLARGRLYYYEREDSRQGEKSNGVINLEYFDQVTEAAPKDCKKATNVFIITSQDRSFFDPGRHLFSADTLPDMKDWIRRLQTALEQIRNNNRPAAATSSPAPAPAPAPATKESGKKRKEESTAETKEDRENKENQQHISTKERKKKKEDSHRPRKSARTGVSGKTQTSMTDSAPAAGEMEAGTQAMASPRGGVQLPGLSAQKAKQGAKTSKSVQPPVTMPQGMDQRKDEDMPHMKAGPTLSCVTKQRVKGPQGRRAPQSNRRTTMALKKRASSLSALEHQDAGDNRSETSQGRPGSNRDSCTPEGNLEEDQELEGEKCSPESLFVIDDIDNDLFFKDQQNKGGNDISNGGGTNNNNSKKVEKQSSTLRVNFENVDHRRSNSCSRSSTLLSTKLTRFRETMVSFKRSRFESKETIGSDHPDLVEQSRWSCSIL